MIKKFVKPFLILIGIILVPILIFKFFFISSFAISNDQETLYQQRILDSKLLLVDYDVWYGRDGNTSGITILESLKKFNFRNIDRLPISFLNNISKDSINAIKLVWSETSDKNYEKIKTEIIETEGLKLEVDFYERHSVTKYCMLNDYSFDSFLETKDSLYLYGLKRKYGNTYKDQSEIRVKKGNIKIISDSIGNVIRLEIKDFINKNGSYYVYEKGSAKIIDSVENSPIICIGISYMKPTAIINEREFSDYGFFKKAK